MHERLVRREEAVPSRQQIPLEPTLARVLAEDLHHTAVGREVVVMGQRLGEPCSLGHVEGRLQPL